MQRSDREDFEVKEEREDKGAKNIARMKRSRG